MRFSLTLPLAVAVLLPAGSAQDAELAEKIDALFAPSLKATEPGGAIVATHRGKTIFRRGYGLGCLELGVAIDPAMVFCLASVTKPFTATAVMKLVEDGKLALADKAGKHLPDIGLDDRITIEHLLSHTSGIKDLMGLPGFGPATIHREFTPEELCAGAKGQALEFEPGSRFKYSNTNYALLARIVEKVSGKGWEEYLQAAVFAPAKMASTVYGGHDRVIKNRVFGYTAKGSGWVRSRPLSFTRGYGLGGLMSSADDLARWDAALRADQILSAATRKRMHTPMTLGDGKASPYALGWFVREIRGYRCIFHSGGIFGWRSMVVRIPDKQVFVAVLTNRDARGNDAPNNAIRTALLIARSADAKK